MDVHEVAPGVYVSSVYPGINVGLVITDDGAVVIDAPPLPADARVWREHVLKLADGPIRFLVLTDDHPDRLLGIGWLEAPVVAGRGTLRRLQDEAKGYWRVAVEKWVRRRPDVRRLDQARPVLPEVAVAGRITLHGSVPVIVETVAGAAPGSVWVRIPQEEVLFAGDTVVVGSHPHLAAAPDTGGWLKTLVELRRARFPARLIVPGRGPVSRKTATSALSEYIQLVRRRIRSLHTAGGNQGDLAGLADEFLSLFPVAAEERELVQKQIRSGLQRVFEELHPGASDR